MAVVSIRLDIMTGQRIATAPGFCALLTRSRLSPHWHQVDVTVGTPETRTALQGRLGTLDDLKQAIEQALEPVT